MVVPLSYDLAAHLGQGSGFSGLMVSAPFAVYLLGPLAAKSRREEREVQQSAVFVAVTLSQEHSAPDVL